MQAQPININDLRVGMYVQLDMPWIRHPFPVSSFLISSERQLAALRKLGPGPARWIPERSDIRLRASGPGEHAARSEPASGPRPTGQVVSIAPPAAEALSNDFRLDMAQERVAAIACRQLCEAATEELRRVQSLAGEDPLAAGVRTKALATRLVSVLEGQGELCIRLIPSGGEDVAAHSMNVSVLALVLGHAFDWATPDLLSMGEGALLHDIGKVAGLRPGPARVAPREAHVTRGAAIVRGMGLSTVGASVVADHHERADGSGYPRGIRSDRMVAAARLVAMVNHYDNLCRPPSGGIGLMPNEAMSTLLQRCPGQHDATLLAAFVDTMGIYPPGSVVELTDGRHALVVRVRNGRRQTARVQVLSAGIAAGESACLELTDPGRLGIRRAVTMSELPIAARESLPSFWRPAYYCERDKCPPGLQAR